MQLALGRAPGLTAQRLRAALATLAEAGSAAHADTAADAGGAGLPAAEERAGAPGEAAEIDGDKPNAALD